MNPLSTLRARRLARPHLLALAAALSLLAAAPASAATNALLCPGGNLQSQNNCWSLNRPPIAADDVLFDGSADGTLMHMSIVGNTASFNRFVIGAARSSPTLTNNGMVIASGANLTLNNGVQIGTANNSKGALYLNYSTLNLAANAVVDVGGTSGVGYLAVQGPSARINGNVFVNNGRIDVAGSTNAAYSAVSGTVSVAANGLANVAGGLYGFVNSGRAVVGTTSANLATPVLTFVQNINAGTLDFAGRSRVGDLYMSGGVTTVKAGVTVERLDFNPNLPTSTNLLDGGQLVLESGATLYHYCPVKRASVRRFARIGGA